MMNIIINNKTFDYFVKRYPKRCSEERIVSKVYESYQGEIKAINFGIYKEYDEDKKCRYLDCECRWSYSNATVHRKEFPATWDGFIQACDWIDQQRVQFAMELL